LEKKFSIFKRKGFFIILNNKDDVKVEIYSKNSTQKIVTKLEYIEDEKMEYFKFKLTELL
jgi:hypothetical protein